MEICLTKNAITYEMKETEKKDDAHVPEWMDCSSGGLFSPVYWPSVSKLGMKK